MRFTAAQVYNLDPVGDQMKLAYNNGQNIRSEWEHASSSTPWGVRKVTFSGCCDGALTRSWFPYKRSFYVKYASQNTRLSSQNATFLFNFKLSIAMCSIAMCYRAMG
jgi:hypothetical protein